MQSQNIYLGLYETTEPLFGRTMKLHILEVGTGSSGFRGTLGEMLRLFSVLGNEKGFESVRQSQMKERMKFVFRRQVEAEQEVYYRFITELNSPDLNYHKAEEDEEERMCLVAHFTTPDILINDVSPSANDLEVFLIKYLQLQSSRLYTINFY